MNQSIGSLETRETGTLGMPLGKFMQFPRTWLHISPLICELPFILFLFFLRKPLNEQLTFSTGIESVQVIFFLWTSIFFFLLKLYK